MAERNMTDIVFDAMLKEAVIANFRTKMEEMPSEEIILEETPFSDEHNRKMEEIFKTEKRQTIIKKVRTVRSYAKVAVFIICITATLTFAAFLTSTEVRAVFRNVIINIFEKFTNIEFEEPQNQEKEAYRFTPQYIPNGFKLIHTEIYGFSFLVIYENANDDIIIINIHPIGSTNIDNENHEFYEVIYDDITYHINKALDEDKFSTVLWITEGFMFEIEGNVVVEEILNMARSMKYNDME